MMKHLDLARHRRLENLLASTLHRGTCAACLMVGFGLIFNAASIAAFDKIGGVLGLAGVALFILLPIIRVSVMIFVFLSDRDYVFVIISATVLVVIGIGAALAIGLTSLGV